MNGGIFRVRCKKRARERERERVEKDKKPWEMQDYRRKKVLLRLVEIFFRILISYRNGSFDAMSTAGKLEWPWESRSIGEAFGVERLGSPFWSSRDSSRSLRHGNELCNTAESNEIYARRKTDKSNPCIWDGYVTSGILQMSIIGWKLWMFAIPILASGIINFCHLYFRWKILVLTIYFN